MCPIPCLLLLQVSHMQKVVGMMMRLNPQLRSELTPLHTEAKLKRQLPDKAELLRFNMKLHQLSIKAFSDGLYLFVRDAAYSQTISAVFNRAHALRMYDDLFTSFLCGNYFPPMRLEVSWVCGLYCFQPLACDIRTLCSVRCMLVCSHLPHACTACNPN